MDATRSHYTKQQFRMDKLNKQKKRQALLNLTYGISLYGICVSLPTLLGVLVRLYEQPDLFLDRQSPYHDEPNVPTIYTFIHDTCMHLISQIIDLSAFYSFHSDPVVRRGFVGDGLNNHTTHISSALNSAGPIQSLFLGKLNDVYLICLLSIFLAMIRLLIMYIFVPAHDNKEHGMVRCRSMHTLRSYDLSHEESENKSFEDNKTKQLRRNQHNNSKTQDKYLSALQYATALFRLLYSLITSVSAFYLFRHADFWPIYLGGKSTSATANCWDLSGAIAFVPGVDQDFDHFNSTLRQYFIIQASYQIQSLFFHCFLFLFSSSSWKWKKSPGDFIRTYTEHVVALALLSSSFLFSSARRLGTVALFALDSSGLFLHLLQICLNYNYMEDKDDEDPDDDDVHHHLLEDYSSIYIKKGSVLVGQNSIVEKKKQKLNKIRSRRNIVWFVHRCLVLPSFMYCRFFILPVIVWYSAAYESHEWLQQMEHAFVPGWSNFVYYFFNGLLMIIVSLNFILFRRLLFHPHVIQVLRGK